MTTQNQHFLCVFSVKNLKQTDKNIQSMVKIPLKSKAKYTFACTDFVQVTISCQVFMTIFQTKFYHNLKKNVERMGKTFFSNELSYSFIFI